MNLNQLYYYKTVCRYSSITRAAKELHISQPAVTKAMRELENELGVILLSRSNKTVAPTAEGEIFLRKSIAILSDLESLMNEMQDMGQRRKTKVRIGISPVLSLLMLPQLFVIAREHFGVNLEIHDVDCAESLRGIEHNDLDLAIALLDDTPYPTVESHILKRTSLQFCTSPGHPLSSQPAISQLALQNQPMILFLPDCLPGDLAEKYSLTSNCMLRTNQLTTLRRYIYSGLASTLHIPESFGNDPQIISIPLEPPVFLSIAILKKKGKHLFEGARQLYSYVGAHPAAVLSPAAFECP